MRPSSLALTLIFVAPLPILAGETPWQEVGPGVSVRLISAGPPSADGKAFAALEISMPENTKTYWRVPGQAGLPTELDFSGSTGIVGHTQHWPYPVRHEQDGVLDYVYFGDTVLPIELQVEGSDPAIALDVTMGICSEICVPAQARFDLPLTDAAPDRANGLRVRQAMAEVPLEWDENAPPIGAVVVAPAGDAIAVEVDPELINVQSLIASTVSGLPLFGAPQKSPNPDLVLLPVLAKGDGQPLEALDVSLTFMTEQGAFEVHRVVGETIAARSED